MPYVEKQKNGIFLIVSKRNKETPHKGGGPRKNFMVIYTDSQYKDVKGKIRLYPHPHIHIGTLVIRCPEELAGKRVRIRVEVIKLPGGIKDEVKDNRRKGKRKNH